MPSYVVGPLTTGCCGYSSNMHWHSVPGQLRSTAMSGQPLVVHRTAVACLIDMLSRSKVKPSEWDSERVVCTNAMSLCSVMCVLSKQTQSCAVFAGFALQRMPWSGRG